MEKAKVFLLGFISALLLLILLGAGRTGDELKRYQLATTGITYPILAVLDTHTGTVRFQAIDNGVKWGQYDVKPSYK